MDVDKGIWQSKDNIRYRLRLLQRNSSSSSKVDGRACSISDKSQQSCSRSSSCNMARSYNSHRERVFSKASSQPYYSSSLLSFSLSSLYPNLVFSCILVVAVIVGGNPASAYGDPAYIRKVNGYQQLLSSDTLRWVKQETAKEPLKLMRPNMEPAAICRVWHTSLRGVGLVSEDQTVCNITTQEGIQGSDKYQTLSTSASRLVWKQWQRPNPPPIGAVAISFKPEKFLATDLNSTVIGYLDPSKNLGSAIFSNYQESVTSCLVLTEIEPERYEMSDVQLKRNKGFIEEDIVLAYGRLKYELPTEKQSVSVSTAGEWFVGQRDDGMNLNPESDENADEGLLMDEIGKKGKVESILSYETNTLDSWGQGYLMAKGLPTSIKLADGSTKSIEWAIPNAQAGKTETMTAVAELVAGTGMNVTLRGTRIDGEMSYLAMLKTIFKDGSFSTRLLEGHRRIKDLQDIRLEHSKIYFLFNESVIPDETTTPTSFLISAEDDTSFQRDNALPVESRNDFLADQSQSSAGFMSVSKPYQAEGSSLLAANNVAHSGGGLGVSPSLFICTSVTALMTAVLTNMLKNLL